MDIVTLTEADKITINNQFNEELILEKVRNNNFSSRKFKEVFISDPSLITANISQTLLNVASNEVTISHLAKQFPNGLFTTSVNSELLSKFSDGTTSTIIKGSNGKINGHQGFLEVDLNVSLNPTLAISTAMQVMAAISGTYYLHKINSKLSKIDNKVSELINLHHDEKIGELVTVYKELSNFSTRKKFDTTDLTDIRMHRSKVSNICNEYENRLKRLSSELMMVKKLDDEKEKMSEINFTIKVLNEASMLSILARVIEIGARLRIEGYTELVKELIDELEREYSQSFYKNIDSEILKIYSERQNKTESDLKKWESKQNENIKLEDLLKPQLPLILPFGPIDGAIKGKQIYDTLRIRYEIIQTKNKSRLEEQYFDKLKMEIKSNYNNYRLENIVQEIIKLPILEREIIYIPVENGESKLYVECTPDIDIIA